MDDCMRSDKPAGWRGELTVTLPISAWDFTDLAARLSSAGRRTRATVFTLLAEATGLDTAEKKSTWWLTSH